MLTINSRYVRRSPQNEESIVIIKTEQELAYHTDLLKEGYTYTEVKVAEVPDDACPTCSA